MISENNSIPTRANRTQYSAAYIGKGIDAKTAPNFPAENNQFYKLQSKAPRKLVTDSIFLKFNIKY